MAGSHITITAQGSASYGGTMICGGVNGLALANPDGQLSVNGNACPSQNRNPTTTLPTAPVGTLLGAINTTPSALTQWFAVGSHYSNTITTSGRLFLIYNDIPASYSNNGGTYTVTISIG
jgi:hypothetical protein